MDKLKTCDLRTKTGNCIIGCQPCKSIDLEICACIRKAYDGGYGDGMLAANRRAAPENKLQCDGCENQKHDGFNYEICVHCKRHWPDHYARKPGNPCAKINPKTPENGSTPADNGAGNKPLTLEQLREMDETPIWVHDLTGNEADDNCFAIVSLNYKPQCFDGYDLSGGVAISLPTNGKSAVALALLSDYGKTWLAYARKPEGST